MAKRLEIVARALPDGQPFKVYGRDAWALSQLIAAANKGCTPIDNPAPRWSAYVHALRTERDLNIETVTELHGGQFSGHHARYVLHSQVQIISRSDPLEMAEAA